MSLLSDQVVGLYDPDEGHLMVRQDVAAGLDHTGMEAIQSRLILIHEVTHALQDQHFDSLDSISEASWASDSVSALECVIEGDATLTMLLAVMEASGGDPSATLNQRFVDNIALAGRAMAAQNESEAFAQAPPYFQHSLLVSYLDGAAFVAAMRLDDGFDAVDRAHRNPPASTRHILHPETYLAGEMPVDASLPEELPGLSGPEYSEVIRSTAGELETGAFLLPIGLETARHAASGWAGDEFAVYQHQQGRVVLVWHLRFGLEGARRFFVAAYDAAIAAGRGPCDEGPDRLVCHSGEDMYALRDDHVAIVRGAEPQGADALIEALLPGRPSAESAATPVQQVAPAPPPSEQHEPE